VYLKKETICLLAMSKLLKTLRALDLSISFNTVGSFTKFAYIYD
jgi:hypothetical protein